MNTMVTDSSTDVMEVSAALERKLSSSYYSADEFRTLAQNDLKAIFRKYGRI